MIEYLRGGIPYKFSPLPANRDTAALYLAIASISKMDKAKPDMTPMLNVISSLPRCIERSMRDSHTEEEINQFIDTVVLDFGNPDSLSILGHLNLLFVGIDPMSVDAKPNA